MSQQVKAFTRHEFPSRMRVSPSRTDERVLLRLNELGLHPWFQQPYYLGWLPWGEHGRYVHLVTTPDYSFDKADPDYPIVVYLDGYKVHLKRQHRDEQLRELLQQRYDLKPIGITYEGNSRREENRIVNMIMEALNK